MIEIHIVGGGLAGCEAALQLAARGLDIHLHEMRPQRPSLAHRTGLLAELVCSNSLKSTDPLTASGCLKAELDTCGCRLLKVAREAAVPGGAALAVDPVLLGEKVEALIKGTPNITLYRDHILDLAPSEQRLWVVCTGPMTSPELQEQLARITGSPGLHFFDAIAPTVTLESLDLETIYRAARYGRGDADYLNIPLDERQYQQLHADLLAAEKIEVKDFERGMLFSGCQPIEEIAASGVQTMAFGPLRPVGLEDPSTGKQAHAVVQLRQENLEGTLFGLVGFQTRIKHPQQKRILRTLPGMAQAEFVRLGQMHRNFYVDSPRCLARDFSFLTRPDVFVAGQICGVEGYVESIASGLMTSFSILARIQSVPLPPLPSESLCGSLMQGFLFDRTASRFTPMNANFGLLPHPGPGFRGKKQRKEAKARRARNALSAWVEGLATGLIPIP